MANIFINHSSADKHFPKDWVANFKSEFTPIVNWYTAEYTSEPYVVWVDENDRVGAQLEPAIVNALDQSDFLISLISPPYLRDIHRYCTAERDYFIQTVAGDADRAKRKVIAAMKFYDKDIPMPGLLDGQFKFKLYKITKGAGGIDIPRPLEKTDPEWNEALVTMAFTIRTELDRDRQPIVPRQKVFLADSELLYKQRLDVYRELGNKSVETWDLTPNLGDVAGYANALNAGFGQSVISVHMFGAQYVPEKSLGDKSVEHFQWEQAVNYVKSNPLLAANFKIISWFPADLSDVSAKQRALVDSIKAENGIPCRNLDFQEKSMEQFKGSLVDAIDHLSR